MSNFTETDVWSDVEVITTTDRVLGGANTAPSNKQFQSLVNRTHWLKGRIYSSGVIDIFKGEGNTLDIPIEYIGKTIRIKSSSVNEARKFSINKPVVSNPCGFRVFLSSIDSLFLDDLYYSGEIINYVYNGTDWMSYLEYEKTSNVPVFCESYNAVYGKGIKLKSVTNSVKIDESLGEISEITIRGEYTPKAGTYIRLFNYNNNRNILTSDGNIDLTIFGQYLGSRKTYNLDTKDNVLLMYDGVKYRIVEGKRASVLNYSVQYLAQSFERSLPSSVSYISCLRVYIDKHDNSNGIARYGLSGTNASDYFPNYTAQDGFFYVSTFVVPSTNIYTIEFFAYPSGDFGDTCTMSIMKGNTGQTVLGTQTVTLSGTYEQINIIVPEIFLSPSDTIWVKVESSVGASIIQDSCIIRIEPVNI